MWIEYFGKIEIQKCRDKILVYIWVKEKRGNIFCFFSISHCMRMRNRFLLKLEQRKIGDGKFCRRLNFEFLIELVLAGYFFNEIMCMNYITQMIIQFVKSLSNLSCSVSKLLSLEFIWMPLQVQVNLCKV